MWAEGGPPPDRERTRVGRSPRCLPKPQRDWYLPSRENQHDGVCQGKTGRLPKRLVAKTCHVLECKRLGAVRRWRPILRRFGAPHFPNASLTLAESNVAGDSSSES